MARNILNVIDLKLSSINGPLVDNFSLTINEGEIVALTGASGSGKTSIGLAILGMLPDGIMLEKGRIEFFKSRNESYHLPHDFMIWPLLRGSHIGYLPQDVFGAFDPVLIIGNQLVLIISERSTLDKSSASTELKSKFIEFGLSDVDRIWNSYPHQLSGGQLQRCLLAMSMVIKPSLIITDEPTSAIDKINQEDLIRSLLHFRNTYNTAILCITHDKNLVVRLADKIVNLQNDSAADQIRNTKKQIKIHETPYILEVKDLEYKYYFGGVLNKKGAQVTGISFNLKPGQSIGIVGESGSGKSTIAQLLLGLLTPSKGGVKLYSRLINFDDYQDLRALRSKVQLVMQDGRGSLHPDKQIISLLKEVRSGVDFKTDISEIESVLKEVGLPVNILTRTASQLSGGECLRVSLARALLIKPDVLVCDEITSSLDSITRDSIISLLFRLQAERSMGLILITHDGYIIKEMADTVMVLSEGIIVETGTAKEVLEAPKHLITQKIFESLPAS